MSATSGATSAGVGRVRPPLRPPAAGRPRAPTYPASSSAGAGGRRQAPPMSRYPVGATITVIVSQWLEAADAEKNVAWARGFGRALQAFAGGGVHVNDLSHDDADRVRTAYGTNYERLTALKTKYDPDNLFRLNPNITAVP
jgi:hypothetical protein